MTVKEETDEIFESRTYRQRPAPGAFSLILEILRVGIGEYLEQMPPDMLAQYATGTVEDTLIEFLASAGRRTAASHTCWLR